MFHISRLFPLKMKSINILDQLTWQKWEFLKDCIDLDHCILYNMSFNGTHHFLHKTCTYLDGFLNFTSQDRVVVSYFTAGK